MKYIIAHNRVQKVALRLLVRSSECGKKGKIHAFSKPLFRTWTS